MLFLPQFSSSFPYLQLAYPLQMMLDLQHLPVSLHLTSLSIGHSSVTKVQNQQRHKLFQNMLVLIVEIELKMYGLRKECT